MSIEITAVRMKTYFGREKELRSIHSTCFHGCGSRSGKPYPFAKSAYLTNDIREPLEIIRPGNLFPAVTRPASALVVTDDVVSSLQGISNIEFLTANVSKVVDTWFEKGDFSYYEDPETNELNDDRAYLAGLPDARSKYPDVPHFSELLVPKLNDVTGKFTTLPIDFYFGEPKYGDAKSFNLSPKLFEKYPVVGIAGITLFRSDVFERIGNAINLDFFCICTRSIE